MAAAEPDRAALLRKEVAVTPWSSEWSSPPSPPPRWTELGLLVGASPPEIVEEGLAPFTDDDEVAGAEDGAGNPVA